MRDSTAAEPGDEAALAAIRSADEDTFVAVVERYRLPLQLHCYRMLGSVEDAEDMVQETLLRAWRSRATFEGRSTVKTWLYRIATNVCLNALERSPRRLVPIDMVPAANPEAVVSAEPDWRPELPWLQPYPDNRLDFTAPAAEQPEFAVVKRETIELAYLAAIQHLPPRQRAVLILRDALGWSAREAAEILETSVASVNSALQRARSTMRDRLPERRGDWRSRTDASDEEREVLRRYVDAHERHDVHGVVALLRDDVRQSMPPAPLWLHGRDAVAAVTAAYLSDGATGDFRFIPTRANRLPAAATYLRRYGDPDYRLIGLVALEIEDGKIVEIHSYSPGLIGAFSLPSIYPSEPHAPLE